MATETQSSLLLSLLVPYINNELHTQLTASDLSVKYHYNDQNSLNAFHVFSNDMFHVFNVYVYTQYTPNTSFSEFRFEDLNKSIPNALLSFDLSGETFEFFLEGTQQVNLVLSLMIGNEFFQLPVGNILPLDYEIPNPITSTVDNYNILLLGNQSPLLVGNSALLLKGD